MLYSRVFSCIPDNNPIDFSFGYNLKALAESKSSDIMALLSLSQNT